ncbi:WD40 repeat domain-containing protein [Streptomyces sp. NPDC093085]|uniref:WD40 repeat domain-containing protein n=1 Tax=Streptomyces sp. NPDC093085 TaxID=3155068 RepID=UPI003431316D
MRYVPRALLAASVAAALVVLGGGPVAVAEDGKPDQSFTIRDARIKESSGLAASRRHPGVYWTHNDSGYGPQVYAVDSRTGETVATITMAGIGEARDVEAISIGPDGNVYVGDIGDNFDGAWDHVWIYRFPEPKELRDATVRVTQFTVEYADGPRDAESLMVHPTTGRVYIASKNKGGGGLYEGPATLSPSGTNVFRRIDEVPWVTDGAFSPDGKELTLRSYIGARSYVWENGKLGAVRSVSAPFQRQAESVTYTLDGTALMFGSEGEQSPVIRVDLDKRPGQGSDSGAGSGGDSGAGGGSGGGKDATAGSGGGDTGGAGSPGNPTVGAIVLAAGALLYLGYRRARRKS